MSDARLLDPVLGLDFHLVHPPGGAPVLVPHPTVGVLFDPFELLPNLGAAGASRAAPVEGGTLALPDGRRWKGLSKRAQRVADQLAARAKLGDVARNRIHRRSCTVTGQAIDVATGKVFSESTDLSLPGAVPFELERVWYSTSDYEGPLGNGWHHGYDAALLVAPLISVLRTPDGRAVAFPPLEPGEAYRDAAEGLTLRREEPSEPNAAPAALDAPYRLETAAGLVYRFGAPPRERDAPGEEPVRHVLLDIESRAGHRVALRYDDTGVLREIHDSAGRVLRLLHDARARIVGVEAPHPDYPGHSFRAVTYAYDELGNLVTVTDALGYAFHYAYAGRLLVKQTDRAGRELYFQWNGSGTGARCARVWSAAGTYAQELSYEPNATLVVDSLGHALRYEHDGARVVTPAG